ncbi:facilitated trehalose transporter Tret1-like [Harmonia axyridis]|uniref:facilitated trehalose transporter Tret1-like n=1 Tax=Harmonia axyridis TaxID=115357 RepID=UPI001E276AD3|nr:facilitated trehalose transporter Tret1-like [Harmonia axyridis]
MTRESYSSLFRGTSPQLIAMLFGTLNALSDGMHFGWSAPTVPKLLRGEEEIKIAQKDVVWLEVLYMLFGLVGLPITIYLADKIGRQKSVLVASATSLVGWSLIGFGDKIVYLFIARSLVGAAADVAFVCSPMYVAEIAHQKIRGFLAGTIYVMELGGILLVYCIAPFVSIKIPPMVGACIVITQLIVFPFLPESPYYHLYKGNEEKAKRSLRRLRGTDDVEDELNEISAAIRRQKSERGRPQDLVMVKSNRKALIIMTILNAAQHMVGYTAILMNLHTILEAAGANYIDSNYAALVFAGVMFFASIASILSVDKFGRKILMNISTIFSGICLIVIAIYYNLKYNEVDVEAVTWIPLVFIMIFAAFFKFGIGTVPIVMTAELFPARVKALGMTVSDGIYVIFASISIYMYQYLYEHFGLHTAFYTFGCFSFLTFFASLFWVPETKGKTLEEIQIMLKD